MLNVFRKLAKQEQGSELVEFSLVLLPLFTFVFAVISIAWLIFAQACLQNGVREGVRFAVTHQSDTDIQKRVQEYSFGFAKDSDLQTVTVRYYNASNMGQAGTGSAGDLVEVSVHVSCPILIPFESISPKINLSATSSDVMEGSSVGS